MTPPYVLPPGSDVQPGLDAPAVGSFTVTPSDDTPLAKPIRSLRVGGEGDVAFRGVDGEDDLWEDVAAGTVIPVRMTHVLDTGTTATKLNGIY